VVRPLGQRQQLPGLLGKALLGEGGELGQVVVGDQWFAPLGGFPGVCELLPLLLQPHKGIKGGLQGPAGLGQQLASSNLEELALVLDQGLVDVDEFRHGKGLHDKAR
jgi:hypothetical protein